MGEEGNVIVTRNSRAFNESGALRPAPADAWPQRLSGSFLLSFFFYSLILQRCIFYFGPRPDGRDQMLVLPSFTGFFLLASSGRWLPSFTEFLRGFILFDYVDRELYLVLLGFTEFYRISSLAVTRLKARLIRKPTRRGISINFNHESKAKVIGKTFQQEKRKKKRSHRREKKR